MHDEITALGMLRWAQAGDEEIQASVTRMRCVIELARNIRDRHNKPLKQPMRRVILSHEDASLLRSLARPVSARAKAVHCCGCADWLSGVAQW